MKICPLSTDESTGNVNSVTWHSQKTSDANWSAKKIV